LPTSVNLINLSYLLILKYFLRCAYIFNTLLVFVNKRIHCIVFFIFIVYIITRRTELTNLI